MTELVDDLEKNFYELIMYNSLTYIYSNRNYILLYNLYLNKNNYIWDCSINVSLWFSKMYNNLNQINIIIEFINCNINKYLSGIKVKNTELQKYMLIDDYNYYLSVYYHLLKHFYYVLNVGFPITHVIDYVLKIMCSHYYHENMIMSKFILEALK